MTTPPIHSAADASAARDSGEAAAGARAGEVGSLGAFIPSVPPESHLAMPVQNF